MGNPFCQEADYRAYVLAHLKHLKYLDYRLVDEQAVQAAREQYQENVLEMEENEKAAEDQAVLDEEKAEKSRLLTAANLKGMDTLFEARAHVRSRPMSDPDQRQIPTNVRSRPVSLPLAHQIPWLI